MNKLMEKFSYVLVPGAFLVAAGYFFHVSAPIAGGFCILVAVLTAHN